MTCPKCGATPPDKAAFCPKCGAALADKGGAAAPQRLAGGFIGAGAPEDPEQVLWQGTVSKRSMIGAWCIAALLTLALLIAGLVARPTGSEWLVGVAVVAAVWIALVLRLLYLQNSIRYYLTNQRFIHERGLLWRVIDRIETIDVDDVKCEQGPVERILGTGKIRIKSSDPSTPDFVLAGIDDVRGVASLVDEARRKERRKRGVYVANV